MTPCRSHTKQSKWQRLCTREAHYLVTSRPAAELQRSRVLPGACWQHAWHTLQHTSQPEGTTIVEVLPSGDYSPIEIAERQKGECSMATKKQAVTLSRVMKAVEADTDLGFCLACGAEQDGCEPDAREYVCDTCGQPRVYGAEEVLMMLA